jgi:hypothetical protein
VIGIGAILKNMSMIKTMAALMRAKLETVDMLPPEIIRKTEVLALDL